MKWTNKGHELDAIGARFVGKKVVIYGAGGCGQEVFHSLGFADCVEGFIDNDSKKQDKGLFGLPVISVNDFVAKRRRDVIVICAIYDFNWLSTFMQQMRKFGYIDGENLFSYDMFKNYYYTIYAWYAWEKIVIRSMSVPMTTVCNLNCKGCLNFTSYHKNKRHFELEDMKHTIDILMEKIDYFNLFHVTGGEPFLYPHLIELLDYIGAKYKNRMFMLGTTTNGTVIPSDEMCCVLKKNNVKIYLDDYMENVELNRQRMKIIQNKLKEYEIWHIIQKHGGWMDLDIDKTNNSNLTEEQLADYYDLCLITYRAIHGTKLYNCDFADFAREAGIWQADDTDYIDLSIDIPKVELVEFIQGFSEKGYCGMCRQCAGNYPINKRKGLKVAVQN